MPRAGSESKFEGGVGGVGKQQTRLDERRWRWATSYWHSSTFLENELVGDRKNLMRDDQEALGLVTHRPCKRPARSRTLAVGWMSSEEISFLGKGKVSS